MTRSAARAAWAALGLWLACGTAAAAPWLDGGRPTARAEQAVALLADAASHGLDPNDYGAAALGSAVARAAASPAFDAVSAAALERSLTSSMLLYFEHLGRGRIDPLQIHQRFKPPRAATFDPAAVLHDALAAGDLMQAERAAAPPLPQYAQLRRALATYRALTGHSAWREPLPALPRPAHQGAAKLESGRPWNGLPTLSTRLQALGDLAPEAAPATMPTSPSSAAPAPPVFEGALVAAVQTFQQRHGLTPDGIVGAATLRQLQVAPAARVRQLELALERLRWTPLMQGPRMVVVNIPEFVLRAYEVHDGRIQVRQTMKVIVGKAMDTRTPMFDEDMRSIEFSPYWNVPPSIARGELLPRLRRDPGYLARQGFEFVGADGRVTTTLTPAALDAVAAGRARLRQRPGAANALGDIKFVFPNRDHIYLHHTPSTGLFERDRRDFSHGCIRVEQPVALAAFVLQGQAGWDEARIRAAMVRGISTTVALEQPVPVLIAYGTALVKDGRVHFYDDIYGHDRKLDAALQRASAAHRHTSTP